MSALKPGDVVYRARISFGGSVLVESAAVEKITSTDAWLKSPGLAFDYRKRHDPERLFRTKRDALWAVRGAVARALESKRRDLAAVNKALAEEPTP